MAEIAIPVRPTWTRQYTERPPAPPAGINVGDTERWLSVLGGGALAAFGLSRGSPLGLGFSAVGESLIYRGLTGYCPLFSALKINTATPRGQATGVRAGRGIKVERSLTIDRPQEELYRFWRNLENLPRFMTHLVSVTNEGHKQSHWVVQGPLGKKVEWDAEIITERPNELIGWRSLPGSSVDNAGSVHFRKAAGDRGTEVHVSLRYDPPAGQVGATLAWLFGKEPGQEIQEDLRRLKQMLE